MSNLNLSLLSRGIGQVAGNGQEKLEVFLEPQDYYNMFPQLKARQKYRKKKWKTKTSHSFPLGPLDMDYLNIPSEEQRNQFFLPPIESRQLSRGTQHTKLTRAGTTARSELVSSPLNVPRTFSTRKGPLLLYSEDLAHKTHEGEIEKRRRRARQLRRLSEMEDSFQLRNISDLSKAILQYGKATNSNEELYLKFLHHRQKDLWARKVRPGFSAKRYISNWSRLWDDNMLNKLKSSGRVSDKTLYRENPFGHSLSTKRRYENLSYIPPPYRLNRSMMQSPGNFGSYEFYRVKPDMIDSGRGTPDSAMDVDQESIVVPTSPPHHPSPFGLIKTVVHEDGNLKELPYNELRLGEKHEVLTELLATAYAHQLSSREGGRPPEMYEEIKDNASTTTQVDMRRAIESLVSSTKPPSRPGAMKHFQRRASVLTMDLPETESAEDNPSQAKYYTGMLKGGGLTSESTLRRASIATTQPGKEMYVSFPSLPNREHSRATPSRQYSSTTFEGTLPPIPAARDRVTKHSDTGYQTEVLQPDMAEVREGTLSETSSVPNLPPIKVGIKRGSLESRSTREMVHIDKVPEKLPTITMEPPTPLHHLGGGTPQKGTPLQERPEIRATLATAGFEPWQSSTDESLEEDEQGWVQMDEAEILRRAEEEEKLAAAAEKQSEKQSSRRTKSSVRSSVGSLKDEVLEEEEEEEEDEESEIEVDEEDEEEEMEEKIEERLSVVVTPKPKSVAQGKETPASKQGKETPASKSSSSGKKVEKFIIGKIPPPKREKVERIEAPPPTAEDAVLPKKEMGKTLPPKGGGVTPRGAEQKVAAKPKPQKQPSQTSLGENLAELTGDGGRKRRGSGSVAGVSVSGSEKSAKSLVVRSLGEGSIGGGDAGSVKSSHESLAPSHVHQSMRGSQMTSRAAKFSGRSDKKKDGASESGSLRGSIIVAPGGEVVSVGGSVKAASESGRSQQQEEEREDDRMSEDSGHMSEGEEEPVEIQSVASGPSLGSQRASKIYGYAKRQEIDVTGGDFDASAFLSARSVKSDDSKSQKSDEEKDARSQKGSVKSSVSNPNLASNAPSLAPIEDEEEEEEEEDWAALAKEASDRESLGSRRTSQSLAASQKSLREHAAAIAAAVLQKQGTGLDLGTDAAVAARLWEEVDDVVRLEDLPPRARSADPQPKQRQKEVVHDQDGNEIEVDVLGPLPAVGQLSQKLSRSAGPLVAVVREMKKQAALLGLEGDFEVDEDTLQQLKDESLNPEDIEIIQDETTGKKVIRSRRSSKASELSSKHSIAPVAATTSISAAPSGTKPVKSSAEAAPKVSKPAPTTVAKPAAKPSEPLKPDVTNYGKADVPEKEEKPQPPVKEKEEVVQKSRVPLAPVVETKKEAKPSPPPKKEEAPKKVETPKKAEPAKKAEPPKEETPKKVETPKTVKPKKEKVAEKEEPKKEAVKEEVKEKAPPKEKESPAKAEKAPKEKEAKKKKKTKSPTKEVEKEEEPETPKKEETPEPPKSDKAKSSKGSAKSEKSTKSKSSLEDRPTFVIGQPKTEVKAEESTPVVPQPKKEPVPKAPKAPAAKKGGKKKGKKEKEKKPEEQAAPEAEEEAAPPEEEIVRSPTPEPEEPEPEPEPEPEEEEEEEVTPPESPAKASSATPSRASPEKTATPALVQPLPFGTVNAPPSTKSEISRDTQSTPEVDTAADEEAAEAAKAAAREKRAQREAARAAAAQKRKEEVERKRKEREDQKRREQEEIERQERMKQELEDERKKRDEDYRRRKEQMEEEKRRQAEEEEKRKQAEVARLERERRQQEEYRRMMAEMQRKKREEEQRKAEIAAEKAREEEERRKEEEEKMAQMEEEERLEYERQKREEEERRRIEEEERRLREEEEARIRMEEAKRLAEQMAKERAILEEKLKFQRGLQSESDNLEHGQNLNPAFTFSYFELLQLLGLQFPTDETDKDVNG